MFLKLSNLVVFTIRVAVSRQDRLEEVKNQKKICVVSCRFLIVVFFCFCYNNASINRKEGLFCVLFLPESQICWKPIWGFPDGILSVMQ